MAQGAAAAPPPPPPASPGATLAQPAAAFLLIDGSVLKGEARLSGCDQKLAALHRQIDDAGAPNVALIGPTTGEIRAAMLHFASAAPGQPHVVVYCGYAASEDGNIFALGSDTSGFTTLGLDQVSIRAFSRLSPSGEGAVVLDLFEPSSDGAVTSAGLDKAAQAWVDDPSLSGRRFAKVAQGSGDPALASALVQGRAVSEDAVAHTLSSRPAPSTDDAAVVPKPVEMPAPTRTQATAQPATRPAAGSGEQPKPAPASVSPAPVPPAEKPATDKADRKPAAPAATDAPRPVARKPAVHHDKPESHEVEAVRRVQVALLAHGFFNGRVTGIDSPATHVAIRRFQAVLGHPVTGVLTPVESKQLGG